MGWVVDWMTQWIFGKTVVTTMMLVGPLEGRPAT